MNIYTYVIDSNLYVNLTNRCSNNCDFCVRNSNKCEQAYEGYNLWLDKEPEAEDIIYELEKRGLANFKEVVFCGFGEPMYRWDVIKKVSDYVHAHKGKTRINTNGQASLILGYDVTREIGRYIDTVNVSLNATDAIKYQELCHSQYGESAFDALIEFARGCVKHCRRTVLSVVDCIGREEIEKAGDIAQSIGAELRVREEI